MASTLLQLVSEQTMQNLLPVLALRPRIIVQIRSSGERFKQAAENLKEAVCAAARTEHFRGLSPEYFEIVIDEISPSTDRSRKKVGEALSLWPNAVVNLTGGTKLMSIGAYLAADYQREPILYCDTHQRVFVSLNERCPLPQLRNFDVVTSSLNVEMVMAAQGRNRESWKSTCPSEALRNFGKRAAAIRAQADQKEFSAFVTVLKKHFRPQGKYSHDTLPFAAKSALEREYFSAATEAGLTIEGPGGSFTSVDRSKSGHENLHKLLDGLWLELLVLDKIKGNCRYRDPHWSVSPSRGSGDFGETDILCVDAQKAGLLLVSCKSIAPSLEHFESLRRRAENFGGSHAQAMLCIHYTPDDRDKYVRWAKSLGVQLVLGETEIERTFQPRSPES